jgi:large subunit ribosomal protein L35
MPKLKTNKSAAKRFRRTKSGQFKRSQAFARHLKTAKTSKRRRGLRKSVLIDPGDISHVRHMLPYSG